MSGRPLHCKDSSGPPPGPPHGPPRSPADDTDDTYRILVAEDDPDMRRMLVKALAGDGHEVLEAGEGDEVLSLLGRCLSAGQNQEPDLIISDIRMPGHSGLEVLAILREIPWPGPVILITAFGDEHTHAEARMLGAAEVFDKPFDVDQLLLAVRALLAPGSGPGNRPGPTE